LLVEQHVIILTPENDFAHQMKDHWRNIRGRAITQMSWLFIYRLIKIVKGFGFFGLKNSPSSLTSATCANLVQRFALKSSWTYFNLQKTANKKLFEVRAP
jgi:hypothetical protein